MPERRAIAVLTTGRQDFGILRSTLLLLRDDRRFTLRLWVGGMHLQPRFGRTVELIRQSGIPISLEIAFVAEPPDPAKDSARALEHVAGALKEDPPEALMLVGDRSETLAAGCAANLCAVPVVHLHGGEETEGAIDNAYRHALTKLSHLHLVSHEQHARRVVQMGEDAERVVVVGAPGLDNLDRDDLPDRATMERQLGIPLEAPVVLVTVHPATLSRDVTAEVRAVAAAMERVPATYVITQPNADAGGAEIREFWVQWAVGRPRARLAEALGEQRYWGLLREVNAVLGNSSSGIIEAPAARLPVVNVGDRQKGRLRVGAVKDVPAAPGAVEHALSWAISPAAREQAAAAQLLYPPVPAAPRIVEALAAWEPPRPPRKAFRDLAWASD